MNKVRYQLNVLKNAYDNHPDFDFLILSLDEDEERSWAALSELNKKKVRIKNLIILSFNDSENNINHVMHTYGGSFIENYRIVNGKKTDYRENLTRIRDIVNLKGSDNLGVDISSMPTPQYFLLIKWISRYLNGIYVYYTKPQMYIMPKGVFQSYYSTSGPVDVSEILGFAGITANDSDSERILVCMLGFDCDLMPVVIQEAGPKKIVAINGFPSYYPKFKDISLLNNEKILSGNEYVSKLERAKNLSNYYYVEADNPFDAYNTLDDIVSNHKNYCVDVVPLGTKAMALGVCLYAIEHREIRVIFPIPEKYVSSTSQKSMMTLEYVLDFDDRR